jgi:biotin carboxyl carrier protein
MPASSEPPAAPSAAPQQPVPASLSLDEVRRVARLLHEADLSEIEIETIPTGSPEEAASAPRVRLQLRRGSTPPRRSLPAAAAPASAPAVAAAPPTASAPSWDVLSPTVGVFRAAQPPLQVGEVVKAGQKAGAVESLKIPTDLLFERAGRIAHVAAEEGAGVEYGQPLFTLESD